MQATLRRVSWVAAVTITLCCTMPSAHAKPLSLYARLGGEPVMKAVVAETIDQVVADPRLNQSFKGTDLGRLKRLIVEQICDISGGGCHYSGDTMREVHEGHNVSQKEFFGLVEVLRKSMRSHHVPLGARNELLALLAPMAPDVIEVPSPPMPKRPVS